MKQSVLFGEEGGGRRLALVEPTAPPVDRPAPPVLLAVACPCSARPYPHLGHAEDLPPAPRLLNPVWRVPGPEGRARQGGFPAPGPHPVRDVTGGGGSGGRAPGLGTGRSPGPRVAGSV